MADEKRKSGGSGTAGRGIENEGTGSLRVPDQKDRQGNVDPSTRADTSGKSEMSEERQGGRESGVSGGKRGVTGGAEKEGEGHSGPVRSGQKKQPETEQNRAEGGAREGYEDHGGSRDEDGTQGESSGSRPGYR